MSPPSALCSSRLDWTWPLQTKTSSLSGKTLQIQGHTPVLPSCAHSHRSLETCRAVSICTGLGVCLRSVTLSVASFVCAWAKNGNKGGNSWYNVGQDKEESSENVLMNQKPSGSHFYFLKAVKYTHHHVGTWQRCVYTIKWKVLGVFGSLLLVRQAFGHFSLLGGSSALRAPRGSQD